MLVIPTLKSKAQTHMDLMEIMTVLDVRVAAEFQMTMMIVEMMMIAVKNLNQSPEMVMTMAKEEKEKVAMKEETMMVLVRVKMKEEKEKVAAMKTVLKESLNQSRNPEITMVEEGILMVERNEANEYTSSYKKWTSNPQISIAGAIAG